MSIFIIDAVGETNDEESRMAIQNICGERDIKCSETLDDQGEVKLRDAEIIIVHLGYITNRDTNSIEQKIEIIRKINKGAVLIGVSSNDKFQSKGRSCGVPSFRYSDVIELIKKTITKHKSTGKNLKLCIQEIISGSEIKTFLLHLFLPLDIDMQTLAYLRKEKTVKEIIDYLTGSAEPVGMLRDGVDYEDKLTVSLQKINEMQELKNKEDIRGLLNSRKNFLVMLSIMKKIVQESKADKVGDAIIKYLNDNNDNFWNNVNSFHDWYCALAE